MPNPVIKTINPILTICKQGKGNIESFNQDLDEVYKYLYKNNLESYIAGPSIGVFYSKKEGKYLACVPIFEFIKNEKLKWHFPVREIYHPKGKKGYNIEIQVPVR